MNTALSIDTPRPLKEYAPSKLELLKAIRREGFLGWMMNTWRQHGDLLRIRMGSQSFVLVTHRASLLSLVPRLIVLDNGRIVADGPKEQVMQALSGGRISVAKR